MDSGVSELSRDDWISWVYQQFHTLVDAMLAAVGDQNISWKLRRTMKILLEFAQLS